MNASKEKRAIQYLKSFEPEAEPYYLCYSGGKDSDAIRILAHLAGVKHDIVHELTTVDAPETVHYIKSIPNVIINRPKLSMWQLIPQKGMPPTRIVRYCCSELKEKGGQGRLKITGVRWEESAKRAENAGYIQIIGKPKTMQSSANKLRINYKLNKQGGMLLNNDNDPSRRFVEHCYRTTATMINPIVNWTDEDVWEFLTHYGCKSNPLYECGFKRIGCIGCPMAGKKRYTHFNLYPKYKILYLRAFERILERQKSLGKKTRFNSAEEVFRWWMEEDPDQITFEEV